MKEILTFRELQDLTGLKQAKRIRSWLREYGIPFIPTTSGIPKVHRMALAHRMGAPVGDPQADAFTPDMSKIF